MYESKDDSGLKDLESRYKNLKPDELAKEAVLTATRQLITSTDFKKPRLARLSKYGELYDGKVQKKLRSFSMFRFRCSRA